MKNVLNVKALILASFIFSLQSVILAAPGMINHQGRIQVDGVPYGAEHCVEGYFMFAIVNAGGEILWTNDGAQPATPSTAVVTTVCNGLFNVILGYTDDMAAIASSVFETDNLYLRVWFSENGNEFQLLSPDQLMTSVGYSLQAEDVYARDINPRSVSIVGYDGKAETVINENGQWVGDPTGLEGPRGATGAAGPTGPTGPSGPAGPVGGSNEQFI